MAKSGTIRVLHTDLHEHPAIQAWRELQSTPVEPERIEILKGKQLEQSKNIKRLVCRLVGVGSAGAAVIGKRCRRASAMIENKIYQEILPYLPISSLYYYGMVEEANGEFCWIFLEDAGEKAYSDLSVEHRALSTQWLSQMHTSAAHLSAPVCLPEKGPNHYLKRLQFARDAILKNLAILTLEADDLTLLETVISHCNVLEAHWDQLQEFCEGIPRTLVHNDFVAKNLRIREGRCGMAILPFDWGESGWGTPATDIMYVDATNYWSMVRGAWPWLDISAIQRLAIVGKIFRGLDAICWELHSLDFGRRLNKTMNHMRIYELWLSDAIGRN